jgi:hypothetical protein
MPAVFLFKLLEYKLIANSSIADKIAKPHNITIVTVKPNIRYMNGKQNNAIPVILFALV